MDYNHPTGFIRCSFKEDSKRYIDHCRITPPMTCRQKQSLLVGDGGQRKLILRLICKK